MHHKFMAMTVKVEALYQDINSPTQYNARPQLRKGQQSYPSRVMYLCGTGPVLVSTYKYFGVNEGNYKPTQ